MKNKILMGLTCLLVLVCVVGCANTKENTNAKKENQEKTDTVKSKCSYYKCLSKMSRDNTIEELNEIVGFDAKKVEDTTNTTTPEKYEYDFGGDKKITVTMSTYSQGILSIKIEYNKKELKNSKVTLDNLSDMESRINEGVSYEEFKNAVGGVDGTLIEIGSWNKYLWVAEDGSSNITASFDSEDGELKFFNGLGF